QSAASTRSATSRDLDPERITALRAGNFTCFSDVFTQADRVQVRTTLFHNTIKDEIMKNLGIGCPEQLTSGKSISQVCNQQTIGVYRN
ncbi:TonB-dependent receptor, partial [Pseudomonas sp. SIMBA_068]